MNILLINHYAGSPTHGMEYRPYYLAKEWVRSGNQVTVVAATHSHLRLHPPRSKGFLTSETIDGIRYIWLRTPSYQGNGIRRTLNMGAFVLQLFQHRGELVSKCRPEAVIASSTYPLDIFPAYRIARETRAKLVFEVHDLWPLTPMELGKMSAWHPFIFTLQRAEDFACRRADRIVSMLPRADTHLRSRGMAQRKFAHIPNGIDVSEWETGADSVPGEHTAAIRDCRARGHFLVGYLGGHGVSNALHIVVQAASLMRDKPVSFILVGQGPEKERLRAQAQEMKLENLLFLPAIPKKAVPTFLSAMDILCLSWNRNPLYRFGISPNKLFDYMMAAKPVLHAVEAGNDLVMESGCGISCPPEDPAALAEAVLQLQGMPAAQREAMGLRGKEYVRKYHDYRILAKRFLEVLQ